MKPFLIFFLLRSIFYTYSSVGEYFNFSMEDQIIATFSFEYAFIFLTILLLGQLHTKTSRLDFTSLIMILFTLPIIVISIIVFQSRSYKQGFDLVLLFVHLAFFAYSYAIIILFSMNFIKEVNNSKRAFLGGLFVYMIGAFTSLFYKTPIFPLLQPIPIYILFKITKPLKEHTQ